MVKRVVYQRFRKKNHVGKKNAHWLMNGKRFYLAFKNNEIIKIRRKNEN